MQIHGPVHVHGPHAITSPHRAQGAQPAQPSYSGLQADEVQFSSEAEMVSRAREMANELPEIRSDRVAEIKAQIASGAYETPEKLDLALERLLDELA